MKPFYAEHAKIFAIRYAIATGVKFVPYTFLQKLIGLFMRRFMSKYASMVPNLARKLRPCALKNIVLLDFVPGDCTDPLRQIEQMVHEACHSYQIRKWNEKRGSRTAGWYRKYFTNRMNRAVTEGAANASAAEVVYFLTEKKPDGPPRLETYYVGEIGQRASDAAYASNVKEVVEHGPSSSTFEASSIAIQILRDMGF